MSAFALAHPFLVFWMFVLALMTVDSVATNLAKALKAKKDKEE